MSKSLSQRHICFTSYNESPPVYDREEMRYLVYQLEECPSTKRLHWQCYIEWWNKITYNKMSEILQVEKSRFRMRFGSRDQAREYCMKPETAQSGYMEFGSWEKGGQGARNDLHELVDKIESGKTDYELLMECPEVVERYRTFIKHSRSVIQEEKGKQYLKEEFPTSLELRPFQHEILEHIASQSDRQITWVADSQGNSGKTFLTKYCIANMGAIRFTNGRTNDISHAYNGESLVFFDFSRSVEERINYQIIEDLKNGMLFSSKYESKCKIFKIPKIVILANFLPDRKKLSEDRWDIIIRDTPAVSLSAATCG